MCVDFITLATQAITGEYSEVFATVTKKVKRDRSDNADASGAIFPSYKLNK